MAQKKTGKRVLVCGGRDYKDQETLDRILDRTKPKEIIHGAARGADTLADNYARRKEIPCRKFPADWNRHGRAAGFRRNQQMLDEGQPDLVIAFPGGPGTRGMVKIAWEQGFAVQVVDEEGRIHKAGVEAPAR